MNRDRWLVRLLVAVHPAPWRRRYGDEYAALLSETLDRTRWHRRPAIVADALRGAADARLRPQGGIPMSSRSPFSIAVWATGLFTVAGISFQKLSEDQVSAAAHPLVGWAFGTLLVAAAVALAAMAGAALPAAVAVARGGSRRPLRLLAVPPIAFAAWYGLLRIILVADDRPVHSAQNLLAAAAVAAGGIVVVAATAWSAAAVLRTAPARSRRSLLIVLTVGMGTATVACVGWGLAVRAATPAGSAGRDGLLATAFLPSWIATAALMAAATLLAAVALRGTQPERRLSQAVPK